MKISVIIPAYNEAESLPRSLEAVLAQDYADFEVIVVDNASADRTFETALSFSGVTVVREDRKGTMWACERGRSEASGDIIVRMDADCIPSKNWLSRGAWHFNDANVAGVTGPYDYHDAKPAFRATSLAFQKSAYVFFNWLMQKTGKGAIMIGGNSFMRASALEAAGGFNTGITFYGDDTDTAKRVAHSGRIIFDNGLAMKTSARRFKKEGMIRLEAQYIYHFFRQTFASERISK